MLVLILEWVLGPGEYDAHHMPRCCAWSRFQPVGKQGSTADVEVIQYKRSRPGDPTTVWDARGTSQPVNTFARWLPPHCPKTSWLVNRY